MAVSKIKQEGYGGTHWFNFVVIGEGWNNYCYGFIPLKNANQMTLQLNTVAYYDGGTYTDVTSSFSINGESPSSEGFAIQCTSTHAYVGKAVRVSVTAS